MICIVWRLTFCRNFKPLNCWALHQGQGAFHCCYVESLYVKDTSLTCLFMKTNTSLFFQRVKQAAMSVFWLFRVKEVWGTLGLLLNDWCFVYSNVRFFTISFALLNTTGYMSPVSHWALCVCMCVCTDASVTPLPEIHDVDSAYQW